MHVVLDLTLIGRGPRCLGLPMSGLAGGLAGELSAAGLDGLVVHASDPDGSGLS